MSARIHIDAFFKDGEFQRIEIRLGFLVLPCAPLKLGQRSDLHVTHLEGIKHVHRHSIRLPVRQVATNSHPQHLIGLPDVDRFALVVEESINTPLIRTQLTLWGRSQSSPMSWPGNNCSVKPKRLKSRMRMG